MTKQPGMTNAEYLRALRAKAVAEGKCYSCRARPARVGARYCDECFQRRADHVKTVAYKKCVVCFADVRGRGTQTCAECSAKQRRRNAERREELLREGSCTRCGAQVNPGNTMCVRCLDDARDRAIARYRAQGMKPSNPCSICGITGHNKRTHYRYVARAVAWRTP